MNKKDKTKIIAIITAFIGLLSVSSLLVGSQESNCLNEVKELQNNMTFAFLNYISISQKIDYIDMILIVGNYSNVAVGKDTVYTSINPDVRNLTQGLFVDSGEWYNLSIKYKKEALDRQDYCDELSSLTKVPLYIIFILSIISIFYTAYPLYEH